MLQWEHSAILLIFIKLPFVIKIFVFSIFELQLKTGFTVMYTIKSLFNTLDINLTYNVLINHIRYSLNTLFT